MGFFSGIGKIVKKVVRVAKKIIKGAIEIMDPMFDHPYAWNNYPTDILKEIKAMWGIV